MTQKIRDSLHLIDTMEKEEFHQKLVATLAASAQFSRMMACGVENASSEDKESVCKLLNSAGLPIEYSSESWFTSGLKAVACKILARAAEVH